MRSVFVILVLFSALFTTGGESSAQTSEDERDPIEDIFGAIIRAIVDEIDDNDENDDSDSGDEAHTLPRDADVPNLIYDRIEKSPAINEISHLQIIKRPHDIYGPFYSAKVVFKPLREGRIACADHYPTKFTTSVARCPDIFEGEPAADGWISCGGFYTRRDIGCPPEPRKPVAPASTPQSKCMLGDEQCETELPGGPGYLRIPKNEIHQLQPEIASLVIDRPQLAESAITASAQMDSVAAEAGTERMRAAAPATKALRMKRITEMYPNMTAMCSDGSCIDNQNNEPIHLPTPLKSPKNHTPCEYKYVRFFTPENRYCPKASRFERPAPGYTLFITWNESEAQSMSVYYHHDDHDGVIRTATMLFGETDDRFPFSEATAFEKAAAEMTAMIVTKDQFVSDGTEATLLDDPAWKPLCAGERFAGLPRPGRCSGVKIGDRLVATSAHCMRNQRQCDETSAIFNFSSATAASETATLDAANVYSCTAIVDSRRPATFGERGADWAIFEVDREIDAPSASLAPSTEIEPGVVTTVIGHPMGLPTVVTRLGVVQASTSQYFVANSDTFVGNSGSAVFGAHSVENGAPKVLGLLTGGRYDFEDQTLEGGTECVTAKWCRDADCLGDDVVYTNDLIAALRKQTP